METAEATSPKEKFISQFIDQENPDARLYEKKVRDEARDALEILDFPTSRDEYWKYTRVAPILKGKYSESPSINISDISPYKIPGLEANLLVFINGFYSTELSEIKEQESIIVLTMAKARSKHPEFIDKYYAQLADHITQPFTALNTVYNTNGVFIHVAQDTNIELPVHILNISDLPANVAIDTQSDAKAIAYNPRNLIIAEQGSKARIISSYETASGSSFTNAVTEIIVHENASLQHHIIQNESADSRQVNTTQVLQQTNSTFSITTATFNGILVRNNLNIIVDAEGCATNLYGLYLIRGKQHVDNHTLVDHKKPNCQSNEVYKGVMDDNSTGVFNGKIFVRQDAQKTNAYQSNANILLSDNATIDSKPELEIYADDVKCSHGSTTGQLDNEALFYLTTRGIPQADAERMLINAFAAEVLEKVEIGPLRNYLENAVKQRFE